MATSSKVMFDLVTLREQALASIDTRIENARRHLATLGDEDSQAEAIKTWRADQKRRLEKLVEFFDDTSDHVLSGLRLDNMPEVSNWERNRAQQLVRDLEATRSRVVAKSEALVGDAEGKISLTKTQLNDFFGI